MKQIFYLQGKVFLEDTPLPQSDENSALIRVTHSVISVGTEAGTVEKSRKDSLAKQISKRPLKALKAVDLGRKKGLAGTLKAVQSLQQDLREAPFQELGYSCSGVKEILLLFLLSH